MTVWSISFIAKGNVAEMPDFAKLDPNDLLVQTTRAISSKWGWRPALPA